MRRGRREKIVEVGNELARIKERMERIGLEDTVEMLRE